MRSFCDRNDNSVSPALILDALNSRRLIDVNLVGAGSFGQPRFAKALN